MGFPALPDRKESSETVDVLPYAHVKLKKERQRTPLWRKVALGETAILVEACS